MNPRSCALLLLALLLACDAEPQAGARPSVSAQPARGPTGAERPPAIEERQVEDDRTPAPLMPYVGRFASRQMSLTLAAATGNDALEGELKIGERPSSPARATLAEGRLRGEFTVGDKAFPFEATLVANGLVLTADGKDYRLERASNDPPKAPLTRPVAPPHTPPDVPDAAALDEALLGLWVQGDPLGEVSDEARSTFSFVSDGTYRYGYSQSADGAAITGQLTTGQVITGQWRTKDGALLTLPRGGAGWVLYATYSRDADRLALTYADGREELFFRP